MAKIPADEKGELSLGDVRVITGWLFGVEHPGEMGQQFNAQTGILPADLVR